MKNEKILTTLAVFSALLSGTVSAEFVNPEEGEMGSGIQIETASHFDGKEVVIADAGNLPGNNFNSDLYKGSR